MDFSGIKKLVIYSVLTLVPFYSFAQNKANVEYELTAEGAVSTGQFTPYMMTVNRFDVLSPRANTGYMSASVKGDFQFLDHWNISGGITGLSSVHSNHRAYLQELYLRATYRKIYLEVGAREQSSPVINRELSSGDFILSGNAKPIPTFHIATDGFVYVPYLHNQLEAYVDFGYGRLLDGDWLEDRFEKYHANHTGSFFTRDISSHHKELYLRSNSSHRFFGTLGMQHAVFFGGIKTTYEFSKEAQVSGKKAKPGDFLKVLIPKSDGSGQNKGDGFVYGNHIGNWYLDFGYNINSGKQIRVYMEKPFEDGSGIAFRNGFDGLWGFEYTVSDRKRSVVHGIVLEYLQTTNQSGPIHWAPGDFNAVVSGKLPSEATGADNYYNNFFYNGYSQYGLSLGSALLKSPYYNPDDFLCYIDNRVQAWYLGFNGDVSSHFDYLVKGSYREGYGTPFIPLKQKHHSFDAMALLRWHDGPWQCSVAYALTQGNVYGDSSGFDFKISYHGKLF